MAKSMRKSQRAKKLRDQGSSQWTHHISLVSGVVGILVSLLGLLLSLFVATSESPKPHVAVPNSLLYFVGGIVVLGMFIVAIAILLQRKNRDVIVLRQRLSEIYLFALRESALNPQSHFTSND